jgi:glycosyltransferase involved in cell wall biosynthesis
VADPVHSIHILGSREFGGADQFYVRLVRALHHSGHLVTAINRPDSPVARALDSGPVRQIHLPLANRWDAWSWWQIRHCIREHAPCVVQTYMGRATRLTRVPHKTAAVHVARLGGFYKIDGYYRHADAWVGNTRAICDFLVKSGMPAKRVHHIGNFVPEPLRPGAEQLAELRLEHGIPENARVVFSLARMIPKKGLADLLEAFALLPRESDGRPLLLVLAGDGPLLADLQTQAVRLEVADRVRFTGWQDPPDAFYALADVFVCPSRHEPLGNVILEAWNHAVPVVSTRSDGAMELIEHGVTGLLCDCRDVAGMAAEIRRMLEAAEADRNRIAAAGNARLHEQYGQTRIVEQYLSLYRDLLKEKTGAA